MLITSNAFNLIDWSKNGVNSCTGAYIQNIVLTEILANCMQGPNFSLGIRFNQYSNLNEGFGTGWELNLSRIDKINGRRLLRLSNGARYWIKEQAGDIPRLGRLLTLQDKYRDTFYCKEYPNNLVSIYYKSGLLEDINTTSGRTIKITHPKGYFININWDQGKLISIIDQAKDNLFSATYQQSDRNKTVEVTMARRTDIYTIQNSNGVDELRLVSIKQGSPLGGSILYSFSYQSYNQNYLLINELSSSVGHNRKEAIRYHDLQRPTGLTQDIKAVSELDIYNGKTTDNASYYTARYQFSAGKNFLGYGHGGVTQWQTDRDNLTSLSNFTFTSIETLGKKKIQYTYNNYYLLTEQSTTSLDNSNVTRGCKVKYHYQIDNPSTPAKIWPAYFLPIEIERSAWEGEKTSSATIERYNYDTYGNVLESIAADGVKTKNIYYSGKVNIPNYCPSDPYGFDNYIKQKIISPANSDINYQKRETYRYSRVQGCQAVVMTLKELTEVDVNDVNNVNTYEKNTYQYFKINKASPFKRGMLNREVCFRFPPKNNGIRGKTLIERKIYEISIDTKNKSLVRTTNLLVRGAAKFNKHLLNKKKYHYLTGDLSSSNDSMKNVISQTYDQLGRKIVCETTLAEKKIKEIEKLTYSDKDGVIERTLSNKPNMYWQFIYNRCGQVVEEKVKTKDSNWVMSLEYTYDEFGRVTNKKDYDYEINDRDNSLKSLLCINSSYEWDYQDNLVSSSSSNRALESFEYNYVNRTKAYIKGGVVIRKDQFNESGKLIEKQLTLSEGELVSLEKYQYNGFGQCCELDISENSKTIKKTQWQYDIRGRITTEKVSAEGSSRTKNYRYDVRFSTEKVIASYLNQRVLETNRYDGLGRLIVTQQDQSQQELVYDKKTNFAQPTKISTSQGNIIEYSYLPDGTLTKKTLTAPSAPHQSWQQLFKYDDSIGVLNSVESKQQFDTSPSVIHSLSESYTYSHNLHSLEKCQIIWQQQSANQPQTPATKTEDTTLEYKVSLKGRVLSAGNNEYRKVYQYLTSGILNRIWYSIDNKVQCYCRLLYGRENRLVTAWLYTRLHDNSLNNRSLFTLFRYRYEYNLYGGDIKQIEYACAKTMATIRGRNVGTNWISIATANYVYDYNKNITEFNVNLGGLVAVDYHQLKSKRSYQENRIFNGYGELTDCKYFGDLSLANQQRKIVQGQSFRYNAQGLLERFITRFNTGQNDIMEYNYFNGSARINTLTHCPLNQGYVDSEEYQWNKDGQLIARIHPNGYKEEYAYGAQQNVATIKSTYPQAGKKSKTFIYDAYDRQVVQVEKYTPAKEEEPIHYQRIHDIYAKDQHIIRRVFDSESANQPQQTIYYHRLFNQVIAISVRDKNAESNKQVTTHININQPDGTPICQCSSVVKNPTRAYSTVKSNLVEYDLDMQWVAQNQQGLLYSPDIITFNNQEAIEQTIDVPVV